MDQPRASHKIIIDIRAMKEKCLDFPEPLRTLILEESNILSAEDFIERVATWEKLLRIIKREGDKA